MQDAWRAYLGLAMGLTEAPRRKAQEVVRRVVGSGGATAAQLQALAEELVSTGLANREALARLVRVEVDRALGAVGLATAEEVAALTRRVRELERQLREATAAPAGGPSPGTTAPAASAPSGAEPAAPVPAPPVKKAVAKKAVARKPPATVSRTEDESAGARSAPAAPKTPARKRQSGGAA
jgi:polyhydroxyalkanoate synthesis regulator phasin